MFRKILVVSLFFSAMVLSWGSYGFAAYSIDGDLSDWGITPFSDWTPHNSDIDYKEEDWGGLVPYTGYIGHGGKPAGGEKYDIEAFYFDDDPDYLYFAMVSSFPFSGRGSIGAGDIGFGFDPLDRYDYGIKIRGLSSADYGLNYVSIRELAPGDSWTNFHGSVDNPIYLAPGVGTEIGLAEIYYWNAESVYGEPGTGVNTWVVEGKMDRMLFAGLTDPGDWIHFHHTMDCYNDFMDLSGDFDKPVVPEPATMSLLGLGLLGLAGWRKRRILA